MPLGGPIVDFSACEFTLFPMSERVTLEKHYDPQSVEGEIYARWESTGAFRADPDKKSPLGSYTIVIPPPNVTGALHLGHALNNTLQDILIRYHRMRGFNTLWQPGTDHAGIATQAVVERRIRETEGKTRHELGREELVRRIWAWKGEYEKRILNQLKLMGCSCDWGYKKVESKSNNSTPLNPPSSKGEALYECDWSNTRFTLDDGLARAVRHMFFNLFKDGLIFRGKRLVNWDTQLQTAVSDDEVYYETVKGHFYHFKYPVIDPKPGEPEYVMIATTRPETMLGDVAVAVLPDPESFFDYERERLTEEWDRVGNRSSRESAEIEAKLAALAARRESHLKPLATLSNMARAGRKLRLPLTDRVIPLICDEWANPMLGSGCVKITPAHDPNDYNVGIRNSLAMINVLTPDGKIAPIIEPDPKAAPMKQGSSENANSEKYAGLAFSTEGRAKVVADMEALGLVESIEDRDIELGHSDRSKLPIEPYLSDQWFVRTGESSETIAVEGLASLAMRAVEDGRIEVFPSRYAKSYLDWLGEKRDWCISRQLWWGHRIPIWTIVCTNAEWIGLQEGSANASFLMGKSEIGKICVRAVRTNAETYLVAGTDNAYEQLAALRDTIDPHEKIEWTLCVDESAQSFDEATRTFQAFEKWLKETDFEQDADVLDTWFSSAAWPFSTLGWPEETQRLKTYYPGSVLVTSRDIITNWVARMVMFGLYAMGEIPFRHVYIHPKILDGRGETMSKSKGNGVDPIDIIHTHGADALRYSMADLTTETQDIRMPVDYLCPHCGKLTEQAAAIKIEEQNRKSRGIKLERKLQPADCQRVKCSHKECGREFATQWADSATKEQLGIGRETSEKFEIGRNFCNKLWNAARYAFMNLEGNKATRQRGNEAGTKGLLPEDRWILARLSQTIRAYHQAIGAYQFSASVKELREFFWDALCDWYIELTKPRLGAYVPRDSTGDGCDQPPPTPSSARSGAMPHGEADPAAEVLAFCLDQVLRLWHPTMPFITERLWQQLNELVPQRGISGVAGLKTDTDLVVAEFPPVEGYPAFEDEKILRTFADLQDAVRGVRDLRAQCAVSPKEAVTVTVIVPPDSIEAFKSHAHIVRHMAGIGELRVAGSGTRPANSASINIRHLRVFVHNVTDDAAERTRAAKELENVEKQIAGKEGKLRNQQFVTNAKPEVVKAESDRLAELVAQRETLRTHLQELGA